MEFPDRPDIDCASRQTDGTDRANAYRDNGHAFHSSITPGTYDVRRRIITYVAPYIKIFPSTYALVFGTRHGVDVFADDILDLYHQGYFKNLIISGGATHQSSVPEAALLLRALVDRGVSEEIILVEKEATNTAENVIFVRKQLRALSIHDLLLIGKISSKRRYAMTVRRHWPEIERICCHGVNYFCCDESQWWKDREFRRRVFSECRKIPLYIDRGFISEIKIVDGLIAESRDRPYFSPSTT